MNPESLEYLALRDARAAVEGTLSALAEEVLLSEAARLDGVALAALDKGDTIGAIHARGLANGYRNSLVVIRRAFDMKESASAETARLQGNPRDEDAGDTGNDPGEGGATFGRRTHSGRANGNGNVGVSILPRRRSFPRP